jgi:hypothetical protein
MQFCFVGHPICHSGEDYLVFLRILTSRHLGPSLRRTLAQRHAAGLNLLGKSPRCP